MAFDRTQMGTLVPRTQRFTYHSGDLLATIIAADYFLPMWEQLPVGTVIEIVYGVGGTIGHTHAVVATSSASGLTVTKTDVA